MPRIQLKLMGALALLVVTIVAGVGTLAERRLRDREMDQIEQSLVERASLVRELLRDRDLDAIEELDALADAAGAAANARITLIERDGRVVGDSEVPLRLLASVESHASRPEVVAALAGERGRSTRESATVRQPLFYLALPPDERSGGIVVRIAVDLHELDGAIAELRSDLLVSVGVGLAAALALSFATTRQILRPLEELRAMVTDVAEGRLDRRLHWQSRDELGEIGSSINRVAEQMRERLARENAEKTRLEAVLGSMAEGVLVLDASGHVTLANPRLQELLDVWTDPVGKAPLDLLRDETLHEKLSAAACQEEPQICELSVGKRTLLVHAVAVPPVSAGGCVAVFHDVSEIRRVDQVRRDFLANASHELRTPLTSIQGFAATLLQGDVPPEEARRFTEVIARNAERLKSLIDDLLELSRLEGRRQPLRPSEVDVGQLSRVLLDDMQPRLDGRSLRAELHLEDPPRAWGDRRGIEQVLTNLIDNAVKYTDEGGRIDVSVRDAGGRVEVEVADTGLGIPEADVGRVFERFYRVDKARSRALGGTGLGLAIVKHLLQAMGGDIRVDSKLGEGSRFTFWLPAAPRADTVGPVSARRAG